MYVWVKFHINQDWVDSMAPATEWLGFFVNRLQRGIGNRGEVVDVVEDHSTVWEQDVQEHKQDVQEHEEEDVQNKAE